jgi:hypothetical protein
VSEDAKYSLRRDEGASANRNDEERIEQISQSAGTHVTVGSGGLVCWELI